MHLEGATDFQFTEIFIYCPKEFQDGLFLSQRTTQTVLCVTALKQIDKKGDKEKQDGYQKAKRFWLHRNFHTFSPKPKPLREKLQ